MTCLFADPRQKAQRSDPSGTLTQWTVQMVCAVHGQELWAHFGILHRPPGSNGTHPCTRTSPLPPPQVTNLLFFTNSYVCGTPLQYSTAIDTRGGQIHFCHDLIYLNNLTNSKQGKKSNLGLFTPRCPKGTQRPSRTAHCAIHFFWETQMETCLKTPEKRQKGGQLKLPKLHFILDAIPCFKSVIHWRRH